VSTLLGGYNLYLVFTQPYVIESLAKRVAELEERVALSHLPYEGDSHGEDRFVPWRPRDEGGWIVHGHVHTAWRHRGRMINVGVDAWGCSPVEEATVAALIDDVADYARPLTAVPGRS
jgi:calcineurin-like phosphoesterase family protein